jgi:hypothetical protein
MMLILDFMPPDQVANTSLNALRKPVATYDKNQTMTQMDESLVALDPEHRASASGAPLVIIFLHGKVFVVGSSGQWFFSILITYV